ncbi:zinc-ribbon domain-containing protein [Clostridiaceae bacterium NSJ-31]|uniref:Zinc-ribbon domain-containing protein n=2 Tax=Ligaoa zhengdingensis TaxID=2763658 RepID=A0A926I331_9FIRM|nr:zinc-ribbon domain-containing protein [Ligaoa zhengdingensis]
MNQMKYCPFCGNPLPLPGAKFCPECGESLVVAPVPEPAAEPELPQRAPRAAHRAEQHSEPEPAAPRLTPEELWRQAISEEVEEEIPMESAVAPPSAVEIKAEPEAAVQAAAPEPSAAPVAVLDFPAASELNEEARDLPIPEPLPVQKREKPAAAVSTQKPKKRSSHGSGVIWMTVAALVLALAGAIGFVLLKMNAANAPQKAVDAFVDAVAQGDNSYVVANIETAGSGLSSSEDVARMVASMREDMDLSALKDHLLSSQGDAMGGYNETYSCFSLKQTKDTLFSQKYVVKVSPVQVKVQTAVEDMTLYVDDKAVSADLAEGGLLLKVSPGSHTIHAVYSAYGPEYELGRAELTGSFSSTVPVEVSLGQGVASLEVELAGTETGLEVLVDGKSSSIQPEGGFIVLHPAFEGMQVTIRCDQYTQDFTVAGGGDQIEAVDYIAQQEAQNPNPASPAEMTNRQLINSLGPRFYSFYLSYLDAINQWKPELIKGVSEAYREDLLQKMEAYNKDLLFDFHAMTFDRRSIDRYEKDGELYATFNVQADYDYAYKSDDSKWFAGGNYQIVTMHYNSGSGEWEVFGTQVKESLDFSSDTFDIKA